MTVSTSLRQWTKEKRNPTSGVKQTYRRIFSTPPRQVYKRIPVTEDEFIFFINDLTSSVIKEVGWEGLANLVTYFLPVETERCPNC